VENYSIIILYGLLFIVGGAIGISRYSLEELDTGNEKKDFNKLLAHFILSASVAVVGGVITKYIISHYAEAIVAGGIVSALIGHARVRAIAYNLIIKKFGLNGNGNSKLNGDNKK
jgi:hypothetical protein